MHDLIYHLTGDEFFLNGILNRKLSAKTFKIEYLKDVTQDPNAIKDIKYTTLSINSEWYLTTFEYWSLCQ